MMWSRITNLSLKDPLRPDGRVSLRRLLRDIFPLEGGESLRNRSTRLFLTWSDSVGAERAKLLVSSRIRLCVALSDGGPREKLIRPIVLD